MAQAEPSATEPGITTDAPSAVEASATVPSPGAATEMAATAEPATPAPAASDTAAAPAEPSPAATDVATTPAAANEPVMTSAVTVPAAEQAPAESPRAAEPAPAAPAAPPAATVPALTAPAAIVVDPDRPAVDPNELTVPRPEPLPRSRTTGEPVKLNGQVAVFISGKEKRIFVRHAFVPVFDMPIEIANAGKPLGTHTYTALEAVDGGTRMRWNVISMPLTAGQPAAHAGKKGAPPKQQRNVRGAVVTSDSSNATDALDRVTIPQEAIDRISELLTPGSSLIISDEGLGRETGRYTEFIVETR
jgi:hypothetical protein